MNSKAKISVLLVEDNTTDAKKIQHQLDVASIRCIVHHADTLFESFSITQSHTVDIVLLDLTLPDSNGFKTLTAFIERVPHIPVIVLANTNNEIVGNQSIKAGAQDFLVKGQFDTRTLARSIRYATQRFSAQIKLQKAASELSVNEKRYLEAQEMAHFGNWEMDIVSNEMKWTGQVYHIFGFQPNSFKPTLSEYLNYVHVEDREKVEDFFEYASKDGKVHQLEHRILIDGHTLKHVAIRGKINFEETTGKIVLIGVIQDISSRKLSEKLIIQKTVTDRKTKIMQEAMSDLSFNIRTPLSSIVNFVYLLKNTALSRQQTELLAALKESVDDMSLVLNNLFNFAILATEELKVENEEFNLGAFLKSNEKVLQLRTDNSKTQFLFQTDQQIPDKVNVDPKKLTLIYYNLINYLTEENNENNTIQIASQVNPVSGNSANLSLNFHRQKFKLSNKEIQNLLNSEQLLEVYDPTIEENADSRSINIAVILKLVKLIGGHMEIQNIAGDVTNFHIQLPITIVERPNFAGGNKPTTALKILLVEDHFLNQIATKKILKSWSSLVSVDIAENGLIAVEKHREHQYDIILMDIQMPVMNGIEASQKIREQSNVPIIALTANASKQEQDRCLAVDINSYLPKPVSPNDLYDRIMQLMSRINVSAAQN